MLPTPFAMSFSSPAMLQYEEEEEIYSSHCRENDKEEDLDLQGGGD